MSCVFSDDSDGKRREAVRRKTAQYLVKAEFLFNTYLKNDEIETKDWSVKPQLSSQDIIHQNVVDRQFGHLTLASLKVIGVIGKVSFITQMLFNIKCVFGNQILIFFHQNTLVQCEGIEGVYVVKVQCFSMLFSIKQSIDSHLSLPFCQGVT